MQFVSFNDKCDHPFFFLPIETNHPMIFLKNHEETPRQPWVRAELYSKAARGPGKWRLTQLLHCDYILRTREIKQRHSYFGWVVFTKSVISRDLPESLIAGQRYQTNCYCVVDFNPLLTYFDTQTGVYLPLDHSVYSRYSTDSVRWHRFNLTYLVDCSRTSFWIC